MFEFGEAVDIEVGRVAVEGVARGQSDKPLQNSRIASQFEPVPLSACKAT
jgi:hypothetical protein